MKDVFNYVSGTLSTVLGGISLGVTFKDYNLDWKIIILLSSGWFAFLSIIIFLFFVINKWNKDKNKIAILKSIVKKHQQEASQLRNISNYIASRNFGENATPKINLNNTENKND